MSRSACVLLLAVAAFAIGNVAADEPLPAPRSTPAVLVPESPPPLVVYRVSRYEVWQHLSPDRSGQFRPRVNLTPQGAFYSYSGQPFPWLSSLPQTFMPYAVD